MSVCAPAMAATLSLHQMIFFSGLRGQDISILPQSSQASSIRRRRCSRKSQSRAARLTWDLIAVNAGCAMGRYSPIVMLARHGFEGTVKWISMKP
jgi:hypothetical protein